MMFTLMKTLLYLALTVLLLAPMAAPAADEAIAQNTIDLSHWKLTLPVSASGAPEGHPLEIPAAQLSAGYTNAGYFHRDADGQLIFWCPVIGARTENTEGARVSFSKLKVSHSDAPSPASGNPAK
jgi:hypothetical protein